MNLDVDARVILQLSYRKCYGSVDWIDMTQGTVKWRAVVYSVMNLMVPLIVDNFLPSAGRICISRNNLLRAVSQAITNFRRKMLP